LLPRVCPPNSEGVPSNTVSELWRRKSRKPTPDGRSVPAQRSGNRNKNGGPHGPPFHKRKGVRVNHECHLRTTTSPEAPHYRADRGHLGFAPVVSSLLTTR